MSENKRLNVKILKGSEYPECWYRNLVGEEFDVIDEGRRENYIVAEDYLLGHNAAWRLIEKAHCEILFMRPSHPIQEGADKCTECGVPEHNHGTACGWDNAS